MFYGFDVGGTKIEFGAFDADLNRLATERVPTPKDDYEALLDIICRLVNEADRQFGVEGKVGIGIPGIESPQDGTVLTSNIPAAKGRTLRVDLEKRLNRHIALDNDANCFALSEAWDSELKNEPTVLGLILGTGFGGGFIVDGKAISGLNHVAGELGHTRLPLDAWWHLGENAPVFECGCGNKACLDSYLSGRGFELLYQHYFGESVSAKEIITLYHQNEPKACEHVERFLELLAICLANIVTGFDPHVVVLGGGLSNFDAIYDQVSERMVPHLLSIANPPRIVKAKHGDAGGVRGAAFLNLR